MSGRRPRLSGVWLCMAMLFWILAWASFAATPLTILVLPPFCDGEGTNIVHWQYTFALLLKDQLRQLQAIRVAPDNGLELASDESADFGMRELVGKKAPGLAEIVKIGKAVEARKILWSAYGWKGEGWYWEARLVDVPTGTKSSWLKAKSTNSWGVVCRMRDLILQEMHVKVSEADRERISRPPTRSDEAMELTSRALYEKNLGGRVSSVQASLARAIKVDPSFALAREALALLLLQQDRTDEAADLLRHSIVTHQASLREHYLYGGALRLQSLNALARDQLELVRDALPRDPMPWMRLGEIAGRGKGDWRGAIPLLANAVKLEPYSAVAHEELGFAYAHLGERDRATSELAVAEHCDGGFDGLIALRLAQAYDLLNDAPHAIPHYERLLAGTERIGLTNAAVADATKQLAELKQRLQPHFVDARMPRTFSSRELKEALQAALTRDECTSLTDPFAATSDMVTWARDLSGGAEPELEKAQRLFSALRRHIDSNPEASHRTAQQAFLEWRNPQANLSCQDYTFLFVVLARELGLKAFYVMINADYRSNLVNHACAGVFVEGKALLVDPAYQWFGVPHVDYQFQNDIEAWGLFLAQSGDLADQRCAVKLVPGQAFPRFALAMNLAAGGHPKEAPEVLEAGLKLDSSTWRSLLARGVVDLYLGEADAAVKVLEECRKLHPAYPELHYLLAESYRMEGDLADALSEYRSFLQNQTNPSLADQAREQVTRLNVLVDDYPWSHAGTPRAPIKRKTGENVSPEVRH